MHINVHFIFVRITFKIPPFKIVISPTTRELATESGSSSTGSRSTAAVELSMLT